MGGIPVPSRSARARNGPVTCILQPAPWSYYSQRLNPSSPPIKASPDPSALIRVLCGERVFGLDTDSKILQAANEVSARAMFEMFVRCDTSHVNWASKYADDLMEITTGDPSILIGFDDGRSQGLESNGEQTLVEDSATGCEVYLRLEFTNEDASYYQFSLFPALNEPFIQGASRKREGRFQHIRVELAHSDDLQVFIQHLRSNPHLKAVHDSDAAAFKAARSESI